MRTVLIALIGLVLGFFCGEAIATMAGMISFAVFFDPFAVTLDHGPVGPEASGGLALRDTLLHRVDYTFFLRSVEYALMFSGYPAQHHCNPL